MGTRNKMPGQGKGNRSCDLHRPDMACEMLGDISFPFPTCSPRIPAIIHLCRVHGPVMVRPNLSPPGAPGLEQPSVTLLVAPRIRSGVKVVFSSHNCYFHSKGHRGGSPGRTLRHQKASSGWGFFPLVMAKL